MKFTKDFHLKSSLLLFILLVLICPASAEELSPLVKPKEASPDSSLAITSEALIGSWNFDMEIGSVHLKGVNEYKPDGKLESRGQLVEGTETINIVIKGVWKIDGATLITKVTESNQPELMPVGEVSKDKILELNANTLRYRDEDGLVVRETRVAAQGKTPAKAVGKPINPEEVKAINAAITMMEESFRKADYDGIVKRTHPSLIRQMGGEIKMRKSLETAVSLLQSGKMKMGEAQLEAPLGLHEAGEEWVCFVPKRSTVEASGRTVRSQSFFVAIRKKTDKEWKLLDGAGFRKNAEMLWTLLPALPREVVIPTVTQEALEE